MATIKLKKGPLSYDGIVHATAANPIVYGVDDDTAAAAVESGFFELLPESKAAKGGKGGKSGKGGAKAPDGDGEDPENQNTDDEDPEGNKNMPPVPDDVELGEK